MDCLQTKSNGHGRHGNRHQLKPLLDWGQENNFKNEDTRCDRVPRLPAIGHLSQSQASLSISEGTSSHKGWETPASRPSTGTTANYQAFSKDTPDLKIVSQSLLVFKTESHSERDEEDPGSMAGYLAGRGLRHHDVTLDQRARSDSTQAQQRLVISPMVDLTPSVSRGTRGKDPGHFIKGPENEKSARLSGNKTEQERTKGEKEEQRTPKNTARRKKKRNQLHLPSLASATETPGEMSFITERNVQSEPSLRQPTQGYQTKGYSSRQDPSQHKISDLVEMVRRMRENTTLQRNVQSKRLFNPSMYDLYARTTRDDSD